MAQRSVPCGISLGVCRLRVTKLDAVTGCVASEADNYIVLEDVIQVQFQPSIETGQDTTLVGGCGCKIASYKSEDIVKRYDLNLQVPTYSPALQSLLLGTQVLFDDSASPVPVGSALPGALNCGDSRQPVAVEFWTKNWVDDAQDSELPWIHWVFPQSLWAPDQSTLQNDFAQPAYAGFSRTNACWGQGPYGDGPEDIYGASDFDTSTPFSFLTPVDPPSSTDCDFASVTPSS